MRGQLLHLLRRRRRSIRSGGSSRPAIKKRRLDHGFAARLLAVEETLDLVAGKSLEFQQPLGQQVQLVARGGEEQQ
jgi:hypothetical protein